MHYWKHSVDWWITFTHEFITIVVEDFQNISMTIRFSTINTRICVNVSIVDDDELENTEDFLARLDPTTVLPAGVRIVPSMAVVYIFDNESE